MGEMVNTEALASVQGNENVVQDMWSEVIVTVNRLLEADDAFGFSRIEARLNPSIEEIVFSLGVIDAALTLMETSGHLDTTEMRQVLNAKQCVLYIRMLAVALRDRNREEYGRVIGLMQNQAQF